MGRIKDTFPSPQISTVLNVSFFISSTLYHPFNIISLPFFLRYTCPFFFISDRTLFVNITIFIITRLTLFRNDTTLCKRDVTTQAHRYHICSSLSFPFWAFSQSFKMHLTHRRDLPRVRTRLRGKDACSRATIYCPL